MLWNYDDLLDLWCVDFFDACVWNHNKKSIFFIQNIYDINFWETTKIDRFSRFDFRSVLKLESISLILKISFQFDFWFVQFWSVGRTDRPMHTPIGWYITKSQSYLSTIILLDTKLEEKLGKKKNHLALQKKIIYISMIFLWCFLKIK